jgi:hypothetical protein
LSCYWHASLLDLNQGPFPSRKLQEHPLSIRTTMDVKTTIGCVVLLALTLVFAYMMYIAHRPNRRHAESKSSLDQRTMSNAIY